MLQTPPKNWLFKKKRVAKNQSDIKRFHQRIRKVDTTLEDITNKLQQNAELRVHIDKAKNLQIRINEKKSFLKQTHDDLVEESKEAWESPPLEKNRAHVRGNAPTPETITNANSQVKILTKQLEKAKRDLSEFNGICSTCEQPSTQP